MLLFNSRYFFPSAQVVDFIGDVTKFSTTKEEPLANMKRDKISIAMVNDTMESSLSSMDSITADKEVGVMDDEDKEDENEDPVSGLCDEIRPLTATYIAGVDLLNNSFEEFKEDVDTLNSSLATAGDEIETRDAKFAQYNSVEFEQCSKKYFKEINTTLATTKNEFLCQYREDIALAPAENTSDVESHE